MQMTEQKILQNLSSINKKESTKANPKILVLCQLFNPELVSTGQTLKEVCEVVFDMAVEIGVVATI